MRVFVKNQRGEPLMPCSPRKSRMLLKEKKARIIQYRPFTIQLTIATGETVQENNLGVDVGSKHVGVAVTSGEKVLTKGEIELRQDIKSLLETRKTYRKSRRNRKTRYRRCKFKYKTKRIYDLKKKKWMKKKLTFESPRLKGWLPPSIQSRITNTFFWIDRYQSLLPNCRLHIEVGKFDVQKMMNPDIKGKDYQEGEAFGYYDARYFVLARDQYTCQVCKKKNKIFNTHHVIYRSHGGSNRADNLITVCTDCHTPENHQKGEIFWEWMIKKKKTKTYKEPPFMNSLRIRISKRYPDAHITYGSVTTPHRKVLGLDKTHYNDAIAMTGIETIKLNPNERFLIKQFRKKKRSLHEATARKGRKAKNITQKRNEKNTKESNGFHLNDEVRTACGKRGFISGFTGKTACYVKSIDGEYIVIKGKTHKQQPIKSLTFIRHNGNWQYQIKENT
ncbi:RNA-guided endonuclease IscB [Domibacillus mangrovi]|uniref:HNH endonuclease n=1 Tax=Domibacillus mangrovi TaxID=1714354 RepID=A0A1Q5P2D3_9BACI|nr:RNA-guided endonuclease IscB [Domibacillus mangrovi]OKL36386.1 HNH endonuclease [Domibacillus mangrovi]